MQSYFKAKDRWAVKLVGKLAAIFDRTNDVLVILAGAVLIFAVLSVTVDVLLRYFFNAPIIWSVVINENNLLYITFLAVAWVLKKDGHVKVELVLNRLNPKAENLLGMITSIIGVITCLVVTWYGSLVTWKDFQRGYYIPTHIAIPEAFVLFIVPVGMFLLSIQFSRRTHGFFMKWRES